MEPLCGNNENSVAVVPMDAGWSDIGSWSAIWDVSEKDASGNRVLGDVVSQDSKNCLVHNESRLVSILGLEDIVVVDTKDALLVANKNKVQNIKKIVETLKNSNRYEWEIHTEVYRPWGKYNSIDVGERYQAKRITVKPGAKLSVQMHKHRAEHWIVVSGTAKVTNGKETFLISENESTYIPLGTVHALENPGKVPLELIEVQTGSYFGEDDIVRFEDNYGRA
jgi:mannose-1-phosphate guanylyltransferase